MLADAPGEGHAQRRQWTCSLVKSFESWLFVRETDMKDFMLCIITFIGSTPAYYHQWSSCFPSRNNVWKFNVRDKFSSWVQIWQNWLFVMNPLALVTFCICHSWSLMLTFFGCWWSSLRWLNFNWRFCVCTGFGDLTHFKGMRIVSKEKNFSVLNANLWL